MLDRYDAIDAAEDVIDDSDVCDRCMCRIKDSDTIDLNRLGSGPDTLATTQRVGSGVAGTAVAFETSHGAIRTHETRTYCASCGSMDGRGADSTLSVQTAVMRSAELGVRLREQGLPINPRELTRLTKHLKRSPEHSGKDDDVLKAAAGMALERARPRDCVRATYGNEP